jgi:hypothetical protein
MLSMTQKIQAVLLAAALIAQSTVSFPQASADSEEKTFIVTAYYSPIPGQSYYLKGSYEADIRLNGKGTH